MRAMNMFELMRWLGVSHRPGRSVSAGLWIPLLLLLMACVSPICAQEEEEDEQGGPRVEIAEKAIEEEIERLEAEEELPEEVREEALELYEEATAELNEADSDKDSAEQYGDLAEEAPQRIEELKDELEQESDPVEIEVPDDASLSDMETEMNRAEEQYEAAQKKLSKLQDEAKHRTERRGEIPRLLEEAEEELEEVKRKLDRAPRETEHREVHRAFLTLQGASRKALENRIEALKTEQRSYEVRKELLPLRTDLAAREVERAGQRAEQWRELVKKRRREEAEEAAREAARVRREAARSHPTIQEIAEKNQELAEQRVGEDGFAHLIDEAGEKLGEIKAIREELANELDNVRDRIEAIGLTRAVGAQLLRRKGELPPLHRHRRELQERSAEIARVQLQMIELEEERTDLALVGQGVERISEDLPEDISESQREEIEKTARELLTARRGLLGSVINDYDVYLSQLVELDSVQRDLVSTAGEYSEFIDRNVLWVQSVPAVSIGTVKNAPGGIKWLVNPRNWAEVSRVLWGDFRTNTVMYLALILAVLALLARRSRWKDRMWTMSDQLHRSETDRFSHTLHALIMVSLLAMPGPLLMMFAGWRLAGAESAFARALAHGFQTAGPCWFALLFVFELVREKGIAESHFRLRGGGPALLRRHLRWFTPVAVVAVVIVYSIEAYGLDTWTESTSRLIYMFLMGTLSVFLALIMRPGGPLIQSLFRRSEEGYIGRTKRLWYGLLVALPAGLVIASALGYHYGAMRMGGRFYLTLLFLGVIVLFYYLALRGVLLVRRRLASERIQEQRAAAEQQEESETAAEAPPEQAMAVPQEDLYALTQQTRRFLRAALGLLFGGGLLVIWSEILPAFSVLQTVDLWSVSVGSGPDAEVLQITLAGLLLALVTFTLSIVAARNIPGLLEMGILQHMPMDRGIRFAISTLCRYTIVAVGVVLGANQLGIGWAKVQWLLAAMSVGLGFGLQEIFGNFISGIIILFERPMRVGDTVTVGDVFGTVTQIRIRATTIQQWDRKELIVPNKEFITGQLINWTLSDTILRLDFPVGIAYGSDIRLAEQKLYEVAESVDNILADPPPRVVFRSFGSSALQFELRAFIPDMENYIGTWHEVNQAIDDAFREAGIVIAFPQQDVHLDVHGSEMPVSVRTVQEEKNDD